MTTLETKKCLSCGKSIKGRTDKKFCDDYCRNNYNNQQKSKGSHSPYVRGIMNTLIKNRKILEKLLPQEKQTMNYIYEKLVQEGFVFKYHTHTYTNKQGEIYYFCFDYGYKQLDNNWYMLVRRKEE
ncbi:MAG: DUF2116 family Zn-ribbon domain-containing protein [Chitinophagales bacterium]|nr:DUF2116 family Zn-ribbon domain-containing protein [Chitinophagales bacterium]